MRVAHLFAGGGGSLLLGDILGWEHVVASDHDPACRFVLRQRWPGVDLHAELNDFPAAHYRGRVDLIAAGWPCPPLSPAGKRLGSADPRDGWPGLVRALGLVRPRFLFAENSPGALTAESGRYWRGVLSDLAALGYDAQWICLRASEAAAISGRHVLSTAADRAQRMGLTVKVPGPWIGDALQAMRIRAIKRIEKGGVV